MIYSVEEGTVNSKLSCQTGDNVFFFTFVLNDCVPHVMKTCGLLEFDFKSQIQRFLASTTDFYLFIY